MATADELRAQLKVAELEEELIKAKGTKKGPSRELKMKVRKARQEFREAQDFDTFEWDEDAQDHVRKAGKG